MSAKTHHAKGHTNKHTAHKKHAAHHAKHNPTHHRKPATHHHTGHKVHAKGTHAHHAKAAGFAVGDLLPVCAAEAVAMSLRLAGQRVTDDEVLELHYLAGGSADVPVSVEAALAAAARFGLAGCMPVAVKQAGEGSAVGHAAVDQLMDDHVLDYLADDLAELAVGVPVGEYAKRLDAAQLKPPVDLFESPLFVHGLILHVDVPGPHAVLATPDGWWSWGELYSPWPCRISEAWAVSWS